MYLLRYILLVSSVQCQIKNKFGLSKKMFYLKGLLQHGGKASICKVRQQRVNFYFVEGINKAIKNWMGSGMRGWHNLMVVQRMFYPETSLFEEGCVCLTQRVSQSSPWEEKKLNQSLDKKHFVHIDQWR